MSPSSPADHRRLYEDLLERAMRHAVRHLPREQAFEIAHDAACGIVRRVMAAGRGDAAPIVVTEGLIYRAVSNRASNARRAARRRGEAERAHEHQRADVTVWAQPATELETRELRDLIDATVAAMPDGMRQVFTLVRVNELSYRDAAARLGVAVGTVHTQLSRANVLLRRAVDAYRTTGETRRARNTSGSRHD